MAKINIFLICLYIIISFFSLHAEDDLISSEINEEELFGDDIIEDTNDDMFDGDMVEDYEDGKLDSDIENMLLEYEGVEIGGDFYFSLTPSWNWVDKDLDAEYIINNFLEPDEVSLTTSLNATLFFNARPEKDFRVSGKVDISYPFNIDEETVSDENEELLELQEFMGIGTQAGRRMDDIIKIRELFADFNWQEIIFFRAGKHMIKWGVGYFFSPADLLNLTPIDPEDPDAEREGPVSIKVHMPVSLHNIYLYIIAEEAAKPEDIAIAPKLEFVIGNLEAGIGGFYKKDSAPAGMLTFSFPFFDLDMFAEAVVSYGANKTFLREINGSLEINDRDDEVFFTGTIGFSFFLTQIDTEWESIVISSQYLYNGYGYSDLSFIHKNPIEFQYLISNDNFEISDLMQSGIHYIAASISWMEILDSDFGLSAFWMGNLSDGSGQITTSINWDILDYLKIRLSIPFIYGGEYDEFTYLGKSFGVKFEVILGQGKF